MTDDLDQSLLFIAAFLCAIGVLLFVLVYLESSLIRPKGAPSAETRRARYVKGLDR